MTGLLTSLGEVTMEKSISIRTSSWYFGTKCLAQVRKPLPMLGYQSDGAGADLNDLDYRMLAAMQWLEELSVSRLARQLGEPVSTIEYRLRRLEQKGVVAGYFYDFGRLNDILGLFGFHLLVRLKAAAPGFAEGFVKT